MTNSNFEVTTVSGKVLPRNKCRRIQEKYYEIGVDCFLMPDNKWHRVGNGKIEFDHETSKYVLLEYSSLTHGVVGFNQGISTSSPFIFGYFSQNPAKNVLISTKEYGVCYCINEEIPIKAGYVEVISSGIFNKKGSIENFNRKGITNKYSFALEYSSSPKIKMFTGAYEEYYKPSFKIEQRLADELKETSFGFEFETENGFIPERLCFRNGLIPVRDGSLRHDGLEPFEFTTIPLKGKKGLETLVDISEILKKYTEIGTRCSLHLHLGGFSPSKEFVFALHKLMIRVQSEIYQMFPSNYQYTSKNGFKSKDYCAPIKNIRMLKADTLDTKFQRIVDHYAGTVGYSFRGFGARNHPRDNENRAKWNIEERYYILNFVPFLWGGSGTLEFRVHPPTQNADKVINWLFICNSILRFAHDNQMEIISDDYNMRPISLEYILNSVYSQEVASILAGYIEERKLLVGRMSEMKDDIGVYEIQNDDIPVANSLIR